MRHCVIWCKGNDQVNPLLEVNLASCWNVDSTWTDISVRSVHYVSWPRTVPQFGLYKYSSKWMNEWILEYLNGYSFLWQFRDFEYYTCFWFTAIVEVTNNVLFKIWIWTWNSAFWIPCAHTNCIWSWQLHMLILKTTSTFFSQREFYPREANLYKDEIIIYVSNNETKTESMFINF